MEPPAAPADEPMAGEAESAAVEEAPPQTAASAAAPVAAQPAPQQQRIPLPPLVDMEEAAHIRTLCANMPAA